MQAPATIVCCKSEPGRSMFAKHNNCAIAIFWRHWRDLRKMEGESRFLNRRGL